MHLLQSLLLVDMLYINSVLLTLLVAFWIFIHLLNPILTSESFVSLCRNFFRFLKKNSLGFFTMVRGRVKGKKQNIISAREDPGSTEGHKIPPNRRRGRPQKPL